MLESLYEDHGDTLALQYGGSQLVHRIKTYRKTAPWTSQGNDIMQTLSRYYSNTFSDTEKQHSINLFLGYYQPQDFLNIKDLTTFSDVTTDHHYLTLAFEPKFNELPLTQWITQKVSQTLPFSASNLNKIVKEVVRIESQHVDMADSYSNYYQPHKLTSFEETIAYQISQIARHFVSTFKTNFSPFEPGRRREDRITNNPSLTGQSSTGSTNSSTTDEDDDSSTTEEESDDISQKIAPGSPGVHKQSNIPMTALEKSYGFTLKKPSEESMEKYKEYVNFWVRSSQIDSPERITLTGQKYEPYPKIVVSEESKRIYREHCDIQAKLTVSEETKRIIREYVKNR